MSNTYTVVATYTGGLNRTYDLELFDLAKQVLGGNGYSGGSGFDFATHVRDHDWEVATEHQAKLLQAVLQLGKAPDLHVSIQPPEEPLS